MTRTISQVQPLDTSDPSVAWLSEISVRTIGDSVTLDIARRVLAQLGARILEGDADAADVVLVDRIAGPGRDVPRDADAYSSWVQRENAGVWVTASAFGLSTARRDAVASELTLLAAGGILGHSRIGDEWAPTVPPGDLALKIVGYAAAVAALHALHEVRVSRQPIHVDLSAQAVVVATGLTLEMAHALSHCPDEGGSARYGAPSGFFECADGSIYVLVLEQHQWSAFRESLAPALDSVETLVMARDRAEYVNEQLRIWAAGRSAEECERVLQASGVPCTQVNSLASLSARANEVGRNLDLTSDSAPPLPASVTRRDVGRVRRATALSEVKVLDAGHVLAVPLGAAWLGAMGADVTKLEDPERLDIYRRRGPFAEGRSGLNRSAYFNQLNFNKSSQELRVVDGSSDLDLDLFDVVLHNLTPRRARAVGVDLENVIQHPAPTLSIASSGFGGTGSWANYRAYGHNIHAFAGLVDATRDARGEVGDMGTPWADPLTSVAIAAWTLAWSLAPEHADATAVDISMAELTAYQLSGLFGRDADSIYTSAPGESQIFVRIGGETELVAVSLRSRTERDELEVIVGQRLPDAVRIGQLIQVESFTLGRGAACAATLSERLLDRGIPSSVVLTAHDLAEDRFVRSTGLFQQVVGGDLGVYEVTGLPWVFSGGRHRDLRAAPERTPGE